MGQRVVVNYERLGKTWRGLQVFHAMGSWICQRHRNQAVKENNHCSCKLFKVFLKQMVKILLAAFQNWINVIN